MYYCVASSDNEKRHIADQDHRCKDLRLRLKALCGIKDINRLSLWITPDFHPRPHKRDCEVCQTLWRKHEHIRKTTQRLLG